MALMPCIKICGLSTPGTVQAAVDQGVDAVGFVFAPGSPRTVSPEEAAALTALVPPEVETVGVFRDQPIDEVLMAARESGVTTVQLHGSEPARDLDELAASGMRTLRAVSAARYTEWPHEWPRDQRLLIDAVAPGSGKRFAAVDLPSPPAGFWLLAGGLDATNVGELLRMHRPSGVDVSSGVEASRGVKGIDLMAGFVRAVRAAV